MLRLIQWLIFGHIHEWKTLEQGVVFAEGASRPSKIWWEQECLSCGKRRKAVS